MRFCRYEEREYPIWIFMDVTCRLCRVRQIAEDTSFASTLTPCERRTLWGQRSVSSMEVCWRADSKKLFSHFDGDGMVDPFQMCTCPSLYSFRPRCTLLTLNDRIKEIRNKDWKKSKLGVICLSICFVWGATDLQKLINYEHHGRILLLAQMMMGIKKKKRWIHCTCSHVSEINPAYAMNNRPVGNLICGSNFILANRKWGGLAYKAETLKVHCYHRQWEIKKGLITVNYCFQSGKLC